MGVLLSQLNDDFDLADKNNYSNDFQIRVLLSKVVELYNTKKELNEDIASLAASKKRCLADRTIEINSQEQIYNRIKEILDIKLDSYSMENSKKDTRLENEMSSLFRKCSSGDLRINQYNHELKRIPKRRLDAENKLIETNAKINEILSLLKIECQQINFGKLKKSGSLLKSNCSNYFSCIGDNKIKVKFIELFFKNYELELKIHQYIYDIAIKTLNNPNFRPNFSFDRKTSFMLKFNNRIYEFILGFVDLRSIYSFNKIEIQSILMILSSLITELTKTFEVMIDNGDYHKNIDRIFQLKEQESLNNKIALKKYHVAFLHKEDINFYTTVEQKFSEMINLIETFFGKQDSSIPNVKRKTYYNK